MKESVLLNESFLTIGQQRFHYTWLRDYCLCPSCCHTGSSQRLFDIGNYIQSPKPLSIEKEDGNIIIQWDEQPAHRSVFPISWLLSRLNNLDLPTPEDDKTNRVLWDRPWLDAHPPQTHSIHACSQSVWIDELMQRGFTILSDIVPNQLEDFLTSIGEVYPTEYGQTCTVKNMPNPKDVTMDAGCILPLHTDLRYMGAHRLAIFQYCVENAVQGGESILVDGFRVAEDFRQKYPDYYQILTEIPVTFRYFDPEFQYFFQHKTPIIKLDGGNNISDIYFGNQNCDRDVPFEKTNQFYEAYCKFDQELKRPEYLYDFRIEPGQIVFLQNFRILHGRMPFDSNSGPRHLEVGYIGWDHLLGRQNFNKVKHLYLKKSCPSN